MTTLIAGLALLIFGQGPVRGFAVVHCLGILTSMFSAVTVSRAIVNLVYGHRRRVAFAESALLGLGEHVIAVAALGGQVVAVGRDLGSGQQLVRPLVVQRQPLQLEEAQRVSRLHDGSVDGRAQVAVLLAGDVHRLSQHRVGGDPRQLVVDLTQLVQRVGQLCRGELRHAPAPGRFEGSCPLQRGLDGGLGDLRGGEQRGQIPTHSRGLHGAHQPSLDD